MKKLIIVIVAVLIISLSYYWIQFKRAIDQVQYGIATGVKVDSLNFSTTTLSIPLWINNPTSFALSVSNLNLDVFINGTYLGRAILDNTYRIEKYGTSIIPLVVAIDNVNAMSILIDVNSKAKEPNWREKVNIQLRGKIRAESGIIYMNNIPLDIDSTYKDWMG